MGDMRRKAQQHKMGSLLLKALDKWLMMCGVKQVWTTPTTEDEVENQTKFILGSRIPDEVIEVLMTAKRPQQQTNSNDPPTNLRKQLNRIVDKSTRKRIHLIERERQKKMRTTIRHDDD